jgi:hypothetical protein
MSVEHSTPYKDPNDRTPEAEEASKNHIEEYLQREGIKGYVLGPTKYAVRENKPFILGLVILDPQKDHPKSLRFFVTSMEKLQFKPLEKDLTPIKESSVRIDGADRNYDFEIKEDMDKRIPNIKGAFSFDDMLLDLEK